MVKILHLKNGTFEACIIKRNAFNRVKSMGLNNFFNNVYIIFFKSERYVNLCISSNTEISDIPGVKTIFSGLRLKFIDSLLSEISLLVCAYKLIRREDIDVITADEPFLTGFNAVFLSFLTKKLSVIYNLADFELFYKTGKRRNLPFLPRFLELFVEKIVFKNADMVITDRKFYHDYVIRRGAKPEKCKDIRVTSDPFYFCASPSKYFKKKADWGNNKILFYFGRLHAEKKVSCLLRCLAKILESDSKVILFLAGEGPNTDELKILAKQLNIDKNVYFLGNKNNQELVDLMSVSDILLATHAGFSLLEMALSAKPIIVFDYEWHSEFIDNSVNGILVKDGDHEAMAEAVLKIISNPSYGREMGLRAKEKAMCLHHPSDALGDERKHYESLLIKSKG